MNIYAISVVRPGTVPTSLSLLPSRSSACNFSFPFKRCITLSLCGCFNAYIFYNFKFSPEQKYHPYLTSKAIVASHKTRNQEVQAATFAHEQ